MTLQTHQGETIQLDQEIASGGEGRIWTIQGQTTQIAKLYHQPTPQHEAKLKAMIQTPPKQPSTHVAIAWPTGLLYQQDQFQGYVMPYVTGYKPVFRYYNPSIRPPKFNWRYLHRTAVNLAVAVEAVHRSGHLIGDVNESNILVNGQTLVTLVDTDSFQVIDKQDYIYRCLVGKPEYTPPELQGKQLKTIDRNQTHDLFGLGCLIFQLLMEGRHPFSGRLINQNRSVGRVDLYCIQHGIFPYQSNKVVAPNPHAPDFGILHPAVQTAFISCFVDGAHQPSQRPTARAWCQLLRRAEEALITCSRNHNHIYADHLADCPWCNHQTVPETLQLTQLDPINKTGKTVPAVKPSVAFPKQLLVENFLWHLVLKWGVGFLTTVFIMGAIALSYSSSAHPSCDSGIDVPITECEALVALYHNTDGLNWHDNLQWIDSNVCEWSGITCNNGHVQSIKLPTNGLKGAIPAELGNLTKLEQLDLMNNKLTGSIPPELGKLVNLQNLMLSRNDISGPIPAELGNLTKLTQLSLWSNRLDGSIPAELGNLTKLEQLDLVSNRLNGPIPPELGNLTKLELLSLAYNKLSGSIPPELGRLTNLTELYLWDNRLSGVIPPELGKLTNLREFNVRNNQLSQSIPPELGKLTNLEQLELSENQLSGSIPPELGKLTNLEQLELSKNQLSGPIPPELGKLTRLIQLNLAHNNLSASIPDELVQLNLVSFSFGETDLCEPPDAAFQAWLDGIQSLWRKNILCEE